MVPRWFCTLRWCIASRASATEPLSKAAARGDGLHEAGESAGGAVLESHVAAQFRCQEIPSAQGTGKVSMPSG